MKKFIHQHLNSFEVAVATMIAIGFLLLGIVLFASLTPQKQTQVARAFDMFDVHTQVAQTVSDIKFVIDAEQEFYDQFYIAFAQVATLPPGTFEMPTYIDTAANKVAIVVDQLADQVQRGYEYQQSLQNNKSEMSQLAYNGKVMGAAIDLSDKLENMVVRENYHSTKLDLYYHYSPPKLNFGAWSMR